MKIKLLILSLLLVTAFSTVKAQDKDSVFIRTLFNRIMKNGAAYDNLFYLCKKIGPRLSGSTRARDAVYYTFELLKQAGADTVYLQPCKVPHWVRGKKEKASVTLLNGYKQQLNVCALGNSVPTPKHGITGQVIEVNNMETLRELGSARIKGKIVFFNFPMNETYVRTFMAYGESGVSRRDGPSRAARYGAVGAIVRSLASNADDYPHTGMTSYNDSFPKIPAIAISTNDANRLSELIAEQKVATVSFSTYCKMDPDEISYNVIGELKGTEHPDQYMLVGGHLDSWDLGEGAHDDGAGCMQSIEVLNSFVKSGYRPKYTLRVVMFMNEENGLKGGLAYADSAQSKNEKHLFALESDAGGFSPRGFALSAKDQEQFSRFKSYMHFFDAYDMGLLTNDGGGADIGPLKKKGTIIGELRPDSQRYFDVHHASTDRFETVSKRELHLGAFAMSAWLYLISEHGL